MYFSHLKKHHSQINFKLVKSWTKVYLEKIIDGLEFNKST